MDTYVHKSPNVTLGSQNLKEELQGKTYWRRIQEN